jgi:hypothetical protein
MSIHATKLNLALEDVAAAAGAIDADLSGNADNRIRGGYMMIEEARVRRLLDTLRALRAARQPELYEF